MGSQWEDEIVAMGVRGVTLPCPPGIPGRFAFSKVLVTLFARQGLAGPTSRLPAKVKPV